MLGLFSRTRSKRAAVTPPRPRLRLEELERRDCPSAPQITLSAQVLTGHRVQLSGSVTADAPVLVTVNFSGAFGGTTTPNTAGQYSLTTGSAELGTVYAVAIDDLMQSSNTAEATIGVTAPSLTLSLSHGAGRWVTLTGQLTSLDQAGQTISFGGVVNGAASTAANGSFSYTAEAAELGDVQASMIDPWGQNSNTPQVSITSNTPAIVGFAAVHGSGTLWTFRGRVTDEAPAGLTVYFGGIPSLAGQSVTVAADGTFSLTIDLAPNEEGTASAQVSDCWGLSATAYDDVRW